MVEWLEPKEPPTAACALITYHILPRQSSTTPVINDGSQRGQAQKEYIICHSVLAMRRFSWVYPRSPKTICSSLPVFPACQVPSGPHPSSSWKPDCSPRSGPGSARCPFLIQDLWPRNACGDTRQPRTVGRGKEKHRCLSSLELINRIELYACPRKRMKHVLQTEGIYACLKESNPCPVSIPESTVQHNYSWYEILRISPNRWRAADRAFSSCRISTWFEHISICGTHK